jgi:hypothetical protein
MWPQEIFTWEHLLPLHWMLRKTKNCPWPFIHLNATIYSTLFNILLNMIAVFLDQPHVITLQVDKSVLNSGGVIKYSPVSNFVVQNT